MIHVKRFLAGTLTASFVVGFILVFSNSELAVTIISNLFFGALSLGAIYCLGAAVIIMLEDVTSDNAISKPSSAEPNNKL